MHFVFHGNKYRALHTDFGQSMLKLQLIQSPLPRTTSFFFFTEGIKFHMDMSETDCDATTSWSIFYAIQAGTG